MRDEKSWSDGVVCSNGALRRDAESRPGVHAGPTGLPSVSRPLAALQGFKFIAPLFDCDKLWFCKVDS
ncbi:hypothetical protein E2C01_023119 [Portunus trituberculatus]|uniref:Uncharacterized protein n=1 Tax=Portunus trituberculatus TaxID=210409 RepID=A0A5B7E933_PORTR|nr:hypothetical protein [Portunus trituberculatus]